MEIEERNSPHFSISEVPCGGIFKSLCGHYYMKISHVAAGSRKIPAINLKTGAYEEFCDNAVIERYYEKSRLILE